jgi:hypothetical protein
MNKKKTFIKIIVTLIIISTMLLISTYSVNALGIAPSKKIILYDTEEHLVTIRIFNTEAKDLTLKVSAEGELSNTIIINEPIIKMRSDELEKEFTYRVILPVDLLPGTKTLIVSVTETNDISNPNAMSGLLTLSHQLIINVPYIGTYAEGYLSVSSTVDNNENIAAINIANTGTENIKKITGSLNVKDLNGKIIYTKNIEERNDLVPKSSVKIEESFNIGKAGRYIVEYDINYDNKKIILNKEFYTGDYNIQITGASVKNFQLGTIAKLDVKVSNNWNVPIEEVYGEIIITDLNNTIVGRANTTKATISPSTGVFTVYWDTTNIQAGTYTINLNLHVGDKIITQSYNSTINNNNIIINDNIELQKETKKINYTAAVVLVSLAGVLILLLFKKRNKKVYK